MVSAIVSLALPACQFPTYSMASGHAGNAGDAAGAMSGGAAGAPDDDGGAAGAGETGGESGESGSAAGGSGGTPKVRCDADACVPAPPKVWQPIAFWQGTAGVLPEECPPGYSNPRDLHHDLNVPNTGCVCTCSAQGQSCQSTLHIFGNKDCTGPCAQASPSGLECDIVSGCIGSQGSARADAPMISGGSCQSKVSAPNDPTWKFDARVCRLDGAAVCEDPSQVCAPIPPSPYLSQLCVMTVVSAGRTPPPCPAGYPSSIPPLYESFSDELGCSPCGCSGVTGGSCSGKMLMSGGIDCSSKPVDFAFGVCKEFDLGPGTIQPTHVGGQYTVVPGTCDVASQSHVIGQAAPSGQITVVCCQDP